MSTEFLTQMRTIIETALLGFLGVALPIVFGIGVAYLRRLAQEKHTEQAVRATEQNSAVEARATGVSVTGPEKYMTVVETLLEAGVKPDPTLIEAAVLGIKQETPCPTGVTVIGPLTGLASFRAGDPLPPPNPGEAPTVGISDVLE